MVSSSYFYEPILYFHHYGEINRRHAAEMTVVCNRYQGEGQARHLNHDRRGQGSWLAAASPRPEDLMAEK